MDIRHRTRFRRDIPRNRKRNGFSEDEIRVSGILSDLGARLGTFKSSPGSCEEVAKVPRPLFIGACEICAPQSRATLGSEKLTSSQGLKNVFSCVLRRELSKMGF